MSDPIQHHLTSPNDLSSEAKQTFQVVAFLATILVVGIHYKSDIPTSSDFDGATWNQLAQEFFFGGIARVAVPIFAFASGFFYFRSDDGSWRTYRHKLKQRCRSVLIPYLIVGSLAMASWLIVRRLEHDPVHLTILEFLSTWLLRPPAEQLWFLRDLMVLVMIAPMIRYLCSTRVISAAFLFAVGSLWLLSFQPFPVLSGWHLLHIETLLFFTLGCKATYHPNLLEKLTTLSNAKTLVAVSVWIGLVALRVYESPNFDIWYASQYSLLALLTHQFSILAGAACLFRLSSQFRHPLLLQISGLSFFIYLSHEFPLRAVVHRIADRLVSEPFQCWLLTPIVVIACCVLGWAFNRYCPSLYTVVTGGRGPAFKQAFGGRRRWNRAKVRLQA